MDKAKIKLLLQRGGRSHKLVKILYNDSKGDITTRLVEPYEFRGNGVYAFCHLRDEIRFFKLNNIKSIEVTETSFEPKFPIKV